jgi:3-hydroxyacyl-CoA dehydrogenase
VRCLSLILPLFLRLPHFRFSFHSHIIRGSPPRDLTDSSRIWAAIKREALFVAAEGVASPSEVDAIFKDVLKTPKGPFEQMDVVGLDVVLAIEQHYADLRPGLPEMPRELLRGMIEQGKLGVKNGRGFYEWEGNRKKESS